MAARIIISYDGTNNEEDAIALGRVLAQAGAEPAIAYVRHSREEDPAEEERARSEADALLERGAERFGVPGVERHLVEDPSTPAGLMALAGEIGAVAVVFCSDSHTAPGSVSIGSSARRLLEGGPLALGIAPAGLAEGGDPRIGRVAALGEGADPAVAATAGSLAERLGASVVSDPRAADLLVLGSRTEAKPGTLRLSAAAEELIPEVRCPVLMVPRGVALDLAGTATAFA
jgi:nucleotide-binding universal stress UspA family protein